MVTKLIRKLSQVKPEHQGAVVTIGNFDGVHAGHQVLLHQVVKEAKQRHVPSLVVTFEPHPFEFFAKENLTTARLSRWREKFAALSTCGVDYVLILKFNQELAMKSAADFIQEILYQSLHLCHLVIGDDFQFGRERQGNIKLLKAAGKTLNFTVEAMPTVTIADARVSSTRIRKALAAGDHPLSQLLLGRQYSMLGRVSHGDKLGRQLGFPTININLHRRIAPVHGIYIVTVLGVASDPWPGVASIGTRPTVNGNKSLLEVHLLNFNQEIYGRAVEVIFHKKCREEITYPNLDELKQQIAKDVEMGRDYFNLDIS